MSADLWTRIDPAHRDLPVDIFLRGADAIHLFTAQAYGFNDLYTNDWHLLRACTALGINGQDLLA